MQVHERYKRNEGGYLEMLVFIAFVAIVVGIIMGIGWIIDYFDHGDDRKAAEYARTHDSQAYTITGEVLQPTKSLVRQIKAAHGYIVGMGGFIGGEFDGAVSEGKGFVQFRVESSEPTTEQANPGSNILIKTEDTKVIGLTPGAGTSFVCVRDFEPVKGAKNADGNPDGVWELDDCRMKDGSFTLPDE